MKLYRVLQTPWVATPRSTRWFLVFLLTLAALSDGLVRIDAHSEHAWVFFSAVMLFLGNAVSWLVLMSNVLPLAFSARRMRLPGIGRAVVWSAPLYAALFIGVPLLCQFPQGHVLSFAILQVLVATSVLLFLTLPYLAPGLFLLLVLFIGALIGFVSPHELSDPRFILWGSLLAGALVLVLAWCWRQLLRGDRVERGARAPGSISFRRNLGEAQIDPLSHAFSMRARQDGRVAHLYLSDAGPKATAQSLSIALDGVYLPRSLIGRPYPWVAVALRLALLGLFLIVVTGGEHSASRSLHYVFSRDGFWVLSWAFVGFSLITVMMRIGWLTRFWGRANAELPLLALLPGLGGAHESKRAVLRVVVERPAVWLGQWLLIGWIGVAIVHAGWPLALAMLLVALACLGYLYAMALNVVGGRSLPAFGKDLLMTGIFVLLSLTVLLPSWGHGWSALLAAGVVSGLPLGLLLLWLGRRGWRGLQRRPHPFLPAESR